MFPILSSRSLCVAPCLAVLSLWLYTLCLAPFAHAATLTVPAQYSTIQAAVNAAVDGDTVLVADGTYSGDGNRDIDFNGKNITVTSVNGPTKTIIDCGGFASTDGSGNYRGFYLHSGELNATIRGFTVENGYESSTDGGGIYLENTVSGTLMVTNCLITNNTAPSAGGIENVNNSTGTITLEGCTIANNTVSYAGGGVLNAGRGTIALADCLITHNMAQYGGLGGGVYNSADDGNATITLTNCALTNNVAPSGGLGGGIYNEGFTQGQHGLIMLTNCTFTHNQAGGYGVAVFVFPGNGTTTLTNCILYGDTGDNGGEIGGTATTTYSDIQGGYDGTGNLDTNPLFVNTPADLHLQATSPCLGAGTANGAPTTTIDGYTRPNPPSIGAYEQAPSPAAPTNLQAVAGNAQVTLTWTAPTGPVTSYTLYRGTSATSLTTLKTGITTTSFTNVSLKNGTTYYYAIAAVNSAGTGPKSSTVSATPFGVPAAPTNLQAAAGNTQVTLTWTAPAGTVTSYTLYRGTSAASLTVLKTGITTTTFTNVSLKNGTTYYYAVAAVNSAGTGAKSSTVSAKPLAPPAAPTNLQAVVGNLQATLSWTAPAGTVTSYTLYRGTSATSLTALKTGITTTSFTNVSLKHGTTYYYTVSAVNSAGTGPASNEVSATP